jgi:hypothetical protein
MQAGQANITATAISAASTSVSCQFPLTGKPAGTWTVVVTNPDGQSSAFSGFTIMNAGATVTLASINPSSGSVNSTITISNLTGTNFQGTSTMRLRRSGYNDIPGTATCLSSTKLTGTFNLTGTVPGTYQVCVANDAVNYICGLSFVINSANAANGSLSVQSNPSGASIYLNSAYRGITGTTITNLTPGSYRLVLQKDGYRSWTDTVVITPGNTTTESATLTLVPTVVPTAATTVQAVTTTPKVTTTTKMSTTLTKITPWPTRAPTPSPGPSPLLLLVATGSGIALLRKR